MYEGLPSGDFVSALVVRFIRSQVAASLCNTNPETDEKIKRPREEARMRGHGRMEDVQKSHLEELECYFHGVVGILFPICGQGKR